MDTSISEFEGLDRFFYVVYPSGKPEDFRSCVVKGFEVNYYNFTLDALTLKPSGFCNVKV